MSTNGFRCAECSRFRKSHSGKGVHLGKLGEGGHLEAPHCDLDAAVNTGSWVLGDGTRVVRGGSTGKRGRGLTSGLAAAAAAAAARELGTLFLGLRKLFLSKGGDWTRSLIYKDQTDWVWKMD